MRIMGVDPGTHRAGVGIIDVSGNKYSLVHFDVIRTVSKEVISKRLKTVFDGFREKIAAFSPDVVVLESLFYAKDIQAVVRIGEARACAMLAAEERAIEICEYAPTVVKKSVTGNGRASKEQIQSIVKKLLKLEGEPPSDAADALAIAMCHQHKHKFKKLNLCSSKR